MAASPAKRRPSPVADTLLIVFSLLVSVFAAELFVRALNGQPLFAFPLPDPVGSASVKPGQLEQIKLADGVDRDWFERDPPALPNRGKPTEEWQKTFNEMMRHPINNEFQPFDAFKAWNSAFAGADPCKHRFLKLAPGMLYLYDPPDGLPRPPYRFPPDRTYPDRLVTNQMGWRGPPTELPRGPKTIRIVFVGSSKVIDGHWVPYSYPEFVGYWLNLWAQAKKLDVRFEVLNSARESNVSTDLAHIVRTEVLPLRPDLVVYYEGGNQFRPESIVEKVPQGSAVRPPGIGASVSPDWLRAASRYSALLGRVQAAIGFAVSDMDGREW